MDYAMTGELERPNSASLPAPTAHAGLGDSARASAPEKQDLAPTPYEIEARRAQQLTTFADFHHQYVGQYIQFADAKAGATFAITTGATAFLINAPGYIEALKLGSPWPISTLAILTFLLLNTSSVMSFLVIVPRLSKGGDSLIFWQSVADLPSGPAYANKLASLSEASLATERVSHTYNLSVVCSRKYLLLQRAMLVAGLAIASTFLYWATQPNVMPDALATTRIESAH
jgi:hypothetical protein